MSKVEAYIADCSEPAKGRFSRLLQVTGSVIVEFKFTIVISENKVFVTGLIAKVLIILLLSLWFGSSWLVQIHLTIHPLVKAIALFRRLNHQIQMSLL